MVGHVSIEERQSPSPGHHHKSYIKYIEKKKFFSKETRYEPKLIQFINDKDDSSTVVKI